MKPHMNHDDPWVLQVLFDNHLIFKPYNYSGSLYAWILTTMFDKDGPWPGDMRPAQQDRSACPILRV